MHERVSKQLEQGPLRDIGENIGLEVHSQKLICKMPHSPARRSPYGRPETSRLLKADHSMLHLRIKMRLGAYASSRQDTDYTGGGVVRSSRGRLITEGPPVLTLMCV